MNRKSSRSPVCAAAVAVLAAAAFVMLPALSGCTASGEEAATAAPSAAQSVPVETASAVATAEAHETEQTGGYPVTVADLSGAEVTVQSANRIVSLAPSITSTLIEEGAADRIVGMDAQSEGVETAELCGESTAPDVNTIASLEPDVVFAGNGIENGAVEQMRSLGIPVILAEPTTFEQIPDSFLLIGQAADADAAAAALVSQLADTVEEASEQRPAMSPTCYFVWRFGDAGNWTCGSGSYVATMIELAGGVPVSGEGTQWIEYPAEDLAAADPDCIIYASGAGSYEDLSLAPGYADLRALQNGLAFEIDEALVSQPGPNVNEGLLALSSIIGEAAEGPVVQPAEETASEPVDS